MATVKTSGKYTDIKFDCFLKKKLSVKEYQEIKVYEPCVIQTPLKSNYHHRYVFLTNHALYVATNPAKDVLYSIPLKNIANIQIIHDSAAFLQSNLRDSVQHLQITYVIKQQNDVLLKTSTTPDLYTIVKNKHALTSAKSDRTSSVQSRQQPKKLTCIYSDIDDITQFPIIERDVIDSTINLSKTNLLLGSSSTINQNTSVDTRISADTTNNDEQHPLQLTSNVFRVQNHLYLDKKKHKMFDVHIYILNEFSTIYAFLLSAWKSYLLNATLNFDEVERTLQREVSDNTTKLLFNQLKQDITHCNDLEASYVLFNELRFGVQRSILIKRLFWKDNSLFFFAIKTVLDCYKDNADSENFGDKIELASIVYSTLSSAMREAEAILKCYEEIAKISVTPRFVDLISSMLTNISDSELITRDILHEHSIAACEVMYELLSIANQHLWPKDAGKKFLTMDSFFTLLSRHNMDAFMRNTIAGCVEICNKQKPHAMLKPDEVVILYRCLSVIYQIIIKNSNLLLFVKNHFQEEFRYYLSIANVATRLPSEFTINSMLLTVLQALINVLQQSSSIV